MMATDNESLERTLSDSNIQEYIKKEQVDKAKLPVHPK